MSLVFNFHTSSIFQSDIKLVPQPNWFNDAIIAFAMEYLQYNTFKLKKDIKFVSPGTAFIIMHEDDDHELGETLRGAGLMEKKLIFFPINNNPFVTEVGGSHWSLLVFDQSSSTFYAFDSAGTMNYTSTVKLVDKLYPFLITKKSKEKKPNLVLFKCPQQVNAYDCGVYVVAFAEFIAQRANNTESLFDNSFKNSVEQTVTPHFVTQTRTRISQWIDEVKTTPAKR